MWLGGLLVGTLGQGRPVEGVVGDGCCGQGGVSSSAGPPALPACPWPTPPLSDGHAGQEQESVAGGHSASLLVEL
jgi:hypothetical protein